MIKVNKQTIKSFIFPGGECQVSLANIVIDEVTKIYAKIQNSNDIIMLLLTVNAVRNIKFDTVIDLIIPYFPYARQDRIANPGEALSVKVMANLINSLELNSVTIYDPHSDVTTALLNNCIVLSQLGIFVNSGLLNTVQGKNLTLVSPDAGAEKKIFAIAKALQKSQYNVDIVCAEKVRDTLTGNISGTKIHGDVNNKNVIIVDDICDGGRTFTELAKVLKENGAQDIYLSITHGIFSQGLEVFEEHFKNIYCANILNDDIQPNNFLKQSWGTHYED